MNTGSNDIGWIRGIVTGIVVLVVGLGLSVFGSDEIITRLAGLSRANVSYVTSAFFVVCVVAAAWILRRLQRRGIV